MNSLAVQLPALSEMSSNSKAGGPRTVVRYATSQRPRHNSCLAAHFCQRHRYLLHNLNPKPLQRRHLLRTIRKQADSAQIQVRENLRADADFALGLSFVVEQGREFAAAVEAERIALSSALHGKSL